MIISSSETGSNVVIVVQRTSVRTAPDWGPAGGVSRPARSLNHALVCNSLQRATYRSAVLCIAPRRAALRCAVLLCSALLCSARMCINCETTAVRPHGEPLRLKMTNVTGPPRQSRQFISSKKTVDRSTRRRIEIRRAPPFLSDIDLLSFFARRKYFWSIN